MATTSVYFAQKLGDGGNILVGKINPLDLLAADPFFGGWGTRRFMNLIFVGPPSGLVPPVLMGAVGSIKTEHISWTIMVFDPDNRTTDYFPDDLFADGNPNYVKASMIAGIGGKALFAGRPQDGFGIGAFYYNLSDELEDSLDPGAGGFGNEAAIEAYYSLSVTPWLYVGGDVQYFHPARRGRKNGVFAALRTSIRF